MRPSEIPTQEGQFGNDEQAVLGARQSGLGVNFAVRAGRQQRFARYRFSDRVPVP